MKLNDLESHLISIFDTKKLKDFPGEYGFTSKGRSDIKRIGYATNLTLKTVEEAINNNIDIMLTHHDAWGFIFGLKEKCIALLAKHGISHFFAHAILDDADFGTNVSLVERLGATIVGKSNLYENVFYAGRIGEFAAPIEFSELVQRLETVLEEPVRSWQNNDRLVKRICVATGGGFMTSDVKDAVDKGCDVYITGEKVLYTLQYAEFTGINLIIGSHTFTEVFGVESLCLKIKDAFPDIEIIRLAEEHME